MNAVFPGGETAFSFFRDCSAGAEHGGFWSRSKVVIFTVFWSEEKASNCLFGAHSVGKERAGEHRGSNLATRGGGKAGVGG